MILKRFMICSFVSACFMVSCNVNNAKTMAGNESVVAEVDTMKFNTDYTSIDTIKVIYTADQEKEVLVKPEDQASIKQMITQFVNDTVWNNSDIMVKMVAPDYMVVLKYTDKSGLEDSWISIWKELGKAKIMNKWYLLPENKTGMFVILDSLK